MPGGREEDKICWVGEKFCWIATQIILDTPGGRGQGGYIGT